MFKFKTEVLYLVTHEAVCLETRLRCCFKHIVMYQIMFVTKKSQQCTKLDKRDEGCAVLNDAKKQALL